MTNLKIIELYKKIALLKFEAKLGYKLGNREKLIEKNSVESFQKKLEKCLTIYGDTEKTTNDKIKMKIKNK